MFDDIEITFNAELNLLKAYMRYWVTFNIHRELYTRCERALFDAAKAGFVAALSNKPVEEKRLHPVSFKFVLANRPTLYDKTIFEAIEKVTHELESDILAIMAYNRSTGSLKHMTEIVTINNLNYEKQGTTPV